MCFFFLWSSCILARLALKHSCLFLLPFYRCLCALSKSAGRGPGLLENLVNIFYKHLSGASSDSQVFHFLIHWVSCNLTQIYGKNETYFHIVVFFCIMRPIIIPFIYYVQLRTTVEVHLLFILYMYWAWKSLFLSLPSSLCLRSLSVSNKLCYLQLIVFILELSCWVDHYFVLDSSFGMVINWC